MIAELNTKLVRINDKIRAYEDEIRYLEEYLTSTSGPIGELAEDLKNNKESLSELHLEYSAVMKQIRELQDAERK